MAREKPTVRERGNRQPIEAASVGSADGCVWEDMPEGAEMIQEQQAIRELGVRREDPAYRNGWEDGAYRNGWEDGRFGPTQSFLENPNLAGWAGHNERLAYYRGHRDGRRVREMLAHGDPA